MKVAIIDYGMGNLRSIQKALEHVGGTTEITSDPDAIREADGVVLPGVGAFGDAIANLRRSGVVPCMAEAVEQDRLMLGICLGLQLFLSRSEEMGDFEGLDFIPGHVIKFQTTAKVPQIGWNTVHFTRPEHFLVDGIPDNAYFYFVHSYHATLAHPGPNTLGTTTYGGVQYPSMICSDSGQLMATQFHPEKSGRWGLHLLQNFVAALKR